MDNNFNRAAGWSLILGSFLMVVTMVLHPVGGSFQAILAASFIGMVSHSIAIASVPVTTFGFWGLTRSLKENQGLAMLSFFIAGAAMIAVMIAAALNGLNLPMFVQRYANASPETIDQIIHIIRYNSTLNHAFDFIFIVGICVAILLWSIVMLQGERFAKWIAYMGILIGSSAIILLAAGFVFVDLHGFRLFIFAIVGWIVLIGFFLIRSKVD